MNTLFLRLESPLQAWGGHESKFFVRRIAEAPTKSGVIGLLCAALGVSRTDAPKAWLPRLRALRMGVRVDRPGTRWWDYHTVGAKMRMRTAEGKTKEGALLSRREYLCDASFLVALQGEEKLLEQLQKALQNPRWTLYLGRKCCLPSRPILAHDGGDFHNLETALCSLEWTPRYKEDPVPEDLTAWLEWQASDSAPQAPPEAEIWYDVPVSFEPPVHHPRFVVRRPFSVSDNGQVRPASKPLQKLPALPPRPRANYQNSVYQKARLQRLAADHGLCVFCKAPATTVQHITYRRAGGQEQPEDLRSLCRLCHDAVTMLEYGHGMELDRINPEDPQWRQAIYEKRQQIIQYRSLEMRRRFLQPEEV
jgi:CRISPR system Cascade subunit CasD